MKTLVISTEVKSRVALEDEQIQMIFDIRLNDLTEINGAWKGKNLCIRLGKVYFRSEHPHNGDEMLDYICEEDNAQYMVQVAALKLQAALDTQIIKGKA